MRKEILKGGDSLGGFLDGLCGKAHKNEKRVIAARGLPGAFLVILGILSHVRFLHVFVSEYLTYCWLVWTLRATSCSAEICHLLLYPILILIILCVMDAFRNI